MKTVGTATRVVEGISKEEIYPFWADVNNWTKWNDDIESATLDGTFFSH